MEDKVPNNRTATARRKSAESTLGNDSFEKKLKYVLIFALPILCAAAFIYEGIFLYQSMNWYETKYGNVGENPDLAYRIYVLLIHTSMVRRSLGIFSGSAILTIGMSIALYTVRQMNRLNLGSRSVTVSIVTASPGLVAMVIGALLIAFSIASKDQFPAYTQGAQKIVNAEGPLDLSGVPPPPKVPK
jgi:hypothetical protein